MEESDKMSYFFVLFNNNNNNVQQCYSPSNANHNDDADKSYQHFASILNVLESCCMAQHDGLADSWQFVLRHGRQRH